jgi:hypothetical protein
MSKKKSKESKKEFDELDKLFNKGALSEEEKADKNEENEEDQELNFGDLEFHQFMQSSEPLGDRAPVLERIAGSQPGPIFVGGIPQTPVGISGEEEKTDEFKYVPGRGGNDEPKYIASDSRISAEPTPVDLMEVGRKQTELIPQVDSETFSMHSEPQQTASPTFERAERVEKIDIERAGRKDPFEEEKAKYKPKLP